MKTGCRRTWGRVRAQKLIQFLLRTFRQNRIGDLFGDSPVRAPSMVPIAWWLRLSIALSSVF
ncbi:MAG: hypothetical protein CMJ50_00120 [Planctomycetaceae bacterium]|nr:hypothetical protein [Planctomycetaceae bacterium]